ncbi:MAG: DUF721 domain-containing protein [Kiritimatiellaeota bacterium]|nr:DUF721 domain-containing protein [Kiritimatiellota bacterium]
MPMARQSSLVTRPAKATMRHRATPFDEEAPMPETEALAIAPAVHAIMGRLTKDAAVACDVLRHEWPLLIGADNAAHSRPLSLVNGTLEVGVKGSIWFSQLKRMGSSALLRRIGERLGTTAVTAIAFRPE